MFLKYIYIYFVNGMNKYAVIKMAKDLDSDHQERNWKKINYFKQINFLSQGKEFFFKKKKTIFFSLYTSIQVPTNFPPPIPSIYHPTPIHSSERVRDITLGKVQGPSYYI